VFSPIRAQLLVRDADFSMHQQRVIKAGSPESNLKYVLSYFKHQYTTKKFTEDERASR
jgi:hypothetical protein